MLLPGRVGVPWSTPQIHNIVFVIIAVAAAVAFLGTSLTCFRKDCVSNLCSFSISVAASVLYTFSKQNVCPSHPIGLTRGRERKDQVMGNCGNILQGLECEWLMERLFGVGVLCFPIGGGGRRDKRAINSGRGIYTALVY